MMDRIDDFEVSGNPYDFTTGQVIQRDGVWLVLSSDGHIVGERPTQGQARAYLEQLRSAHDDPPPT